MTWRDPACGRKALIAAVAVAPIAIWMRLLATLMPTADNISVALQLEHLIAHPLALPSAMANSFISNRKWLWETAIGNLGWTDAPMPGWYYAAATAALAFALVAPENRGPVLRPALLATVTFVGLLTATCLALYLSWTHRGPKAWSAMVNRTPAGR